MRLSLRGIAATAATAAVVGIMAIGTPAPTHAAALAGDAVTYNLTFSGTTYPFNAVETNSHGTLSGTVSPPNSSCPGTLSGTLKKGKLNITFVYTGTPCDGETTTLTGTQRAHSGHGTVVDNRIGSGTYTFTDATLSSPAACAASGRLTALSCVR